MDIFSGILGGVSGIWDQVTIATGGKTEAMKVAETQKQAEQERTKQMELSLQAAGLNAYTALQNTSNSGINSKYWIIGGGVGLGVILLVVLFIVALRR